MESEADPLSDNSPAKHTLSEADFAELSIGGGSADVIRELWGGQISRRLVLLRAFYDAANGEPTLLGPMPPIKDAWQALERAQESDPDAVKALIAHPQVGSWLAYALRRLRGGARSDAPLHIDFGQIHVLALAAAALARQSMTTRVPLRDGRVMVPCFGMASFEDCGPWDVADAEVEDGRIRFSHRGRVVEVPETPETDADGWWGLRRVTIHADPSLSVWLDDLDPMRDLADPVPPVRLSDAEVQRWTDLLRDAWAILSKGHPEIAQAMAAGVTSLVPLPIGDGWDTRSASTGDAFGAILCSPPPDAVTLAVSLAHEFMHIKLGGLMHLLPIIERDSTATLYAPWRDDPRPLGGLTQGVYAFVGIAAFWRRHRHDVTGTEQRLAHFEYCYARAQAQEGLANARTAGGLTPHGEAFLAGLATEVDSWSQDTVPEEIATLSHLVALGHRIGWRLRHCRPSDEDIEALAAAWSTETATSLHIGPSIVHPDPEMRHWSQGRLGLARRKILAPEHCLTAPNASWGRGLTDADLLLFEGDAAAARDCFAKQIAEDPEQADAWTGLGLALDAGRPHGGAGHRAMTERPEVVRAVYRRIATDPSRRPSPLDVAAWLDAFVAP